MQNLNTTLKSCYMMALMQGDTDFNHFIMAGIIFPHSFHVVCIYFQQGSKMDLLVSIVTVVEAVVELSHGGGKSPETLSVMTPLALTKCFQ